MPWRLTSEVLAKRGESIALSGLDGTLTYRILQGRAEAVADALRSNGIEEGDAVALLSGRRAYDEVVGLLGILLAKATAVPLDHNAPSLRQASILAQCGCRAVVHDEDAADQLVPILKDTLRIELDADGYVLASVGHAPTPSQTATPALACVLHTSGSTGTPKSVPITWEGLDVFTDWMIKLTDLGPGDRVLRVAELVFDLAWFDHIATIRAGANLCAMPRKQLTTGRAIAHEVERLAPSIIYSVPSFFMKLCKAWPDARPLGPSLRVACFAGEVFPPHALLDFASRTKHASLFNLFGPTETNVCTYYQVDPERLDGVAELPIGQACPYAQCHLISEENDEQTVDGPGVGELLVRGPTALGGEVRTGDRVERGADGLFYFRGRRDRMVKIHGYRIEPGEVEALLDQQPLIERAAVIARQHDRLGAYLHAFVVPAAGEELDLRTLRQQLAERLPRQLLPDNFTVLAELPQSTTGKIDYRALAEQSP